VPRFAVDQGTRSDGTRKIRPVDHMSWSHSDQRKRSRREMKAQSINGHYEVPERVKHDHLDVLLAVMRLHMLIIGQVCFLPACCLVNVVSLLA
jgi:hypothetical protein